MEMEKFREDLVNAHNSLRNLHGCPLLTAAEDLHKTAQGWAETLADKGFLQYSENSGIGESIIFLDVNGRGPCGQSLAQDWYRESASYEFSDPHWCKDAIHFTQMIWRSTADVGVGVSKINDQEKYVVVVHYRPPGNSNMPGDFKKNVPQPL